MTYQEFKQNLWTLLDLDNRAITFHILDTEFGVSVGSGIVESSDDLYDTDATDMLMDNTDASFIQVYSAESWMLGNGEADHADSADVELLQSAMEKFNGFFDLFIRELADPLCSLGEFEWKNPHYEPDDDDDWDDEDYDDEEYYD